MLVSHRLRATTGEVFGGKRGKRDYLVLNPEPPLAQTQPPGKNRNSILHSRYFSLRELLIG